LIFHGTALPHCLNNIWRCVGLLAYVGELESGIRSEKKCKDDERIFERERGREGEREREIHCFQTLFTVPK
jgi:hypothetical protein